MKISYICSINKNKEIEKYSLIIVQCCISNDPNSVLASSMGTYEQFKNARNAWEAKFPEYRNGTFTNYYSACAKYQTDTTVELKRDGTYDCVVLLGIRNGRSGGEE